LDSWSSILDGIFLAARHNHRAVFIRGIDSAGVVKCAAGVKNVTLRELEELTGKHHKFLKQCLESVPFTSGPNRAHIYQSPAALAAIYHVTKSLEAARTRQAESIALK
jgi:hypothetical protein